MRIKNIPYKSLPFEVAIWDGMRRGSGYSSPYFPNSFWSRDNGNTKKEGKSLKREITQLLSEAKTRGSSASASSFVSSSVATSQRFQESPETLSDEHHHHQHQQHQNHQQVTERETNNKSRRKASSSSDSTSNHDEASELTDLQKHILRIIKEKGGKAGFNSILEEIQKLWKKLRKRDGSRYANELKRAVSSTLATSSTGFSLFEKDHVLPSGEIWWKMGAKGLSLNLDYQAIKNEVQSDNSSKNSEEETTETAEAAPPPKRRRMNSNYSTSQAQVTEVSEEEEEEAEEEEEEEQEEEENENENENENEKSSSEHEFQAAQSLISRKVKKEESHETPKPFLSRRRKSSNVQQEESLDINKQIDTSSFTELEKTVLEVIIENNGSASFDQIVTHASRTWANIKKKDGSMFGDCKKAVKAALLYGHQGESGPFFEADPKKEGNWRLSSTSLPTKQTTKQETSDNEEETSFSSSSEVEEETIVSKRKKKRPDKPTNNHSANQTTKLTEMHEVLIRIVLSFGGVCTFEEIFDKVVALKAKNHKGVRQLGSDVKRALLASLSHNPPGNFVKTKDGLWTVAPKALGIAKKIVEESDDLSMDKINDVIYK